MNWAGRVRLHGVCYFKFKEIWLGIFGSYSLFLNIGLSLSLFDLWLTLNCRDFRFLPTQRGLYVAISSR